MHSRQKQLSQAVATGTRLGVMPVIINKTMTYLIKSVVGKKAQYYPAWGVSSINDPTYQALTTGIARSAVTTRRNNETKQS